jgi:hypothetical protein
MVMGGKGSRSSVYVYEYGEAYDDLRTAFFIDERDYNDPELAESALESAEAAMTRAGVIYEVEVTSGIHATRPIGVPTWEAFKQRHFVDGVPLPVRPMQQQLTIPPSWHAMVEAVDTAYHMFRAELMELLAEAMPSGQIAVTWDRGPLRRSPGSVDWSEEKFGFEIRLKAGLVDTSPAEALNSVGTALARRGWALKEPDPEQAEYQASRNLFTVSIRADQTTLMLFGESPLYWSPAEAGSSYVVEAR